ncbi:MAG: translation elongation factor Ts [Desulfuromonadales bacterium]|nr:translation elongation factor Ts [Desulfuromonadales bacterium]
MATITAKMVGDLRAKTGAGMMDCKKALTEAEGDMEQAIDLLRKKGLSAAAKKSGRVAAEGMIAATGDGKRGALVEVNSETDFVAKNDAFQAFANGVAEVTLSENPADVDTLKGLAFPGSQRSVGEELTHQIATIGENMNIRRFARLESASGVTASYVHGGGKIGVLVQLDAEKGDDPQVAETARMLAMHVAAANPQYLCRADVPADVVEREKDIMRVKAIESGKPENIVEKIIEGQINKFFGEICLLEQVYVIDTDKKVGKVVEALAKELGGQVTLTAYSRFQLGEGIEKKEDDFAAEVASMTK